MYCRKCGRDLPDDVDVCPVCGTLTRKAVRKKRGSPIKRCIIAVDFLTFLTGVIHAFLLATASHYVRSSQNGLLYDRLVQYSLHPMLRLVDSVFTLLLIAMFICAVIMRYQLMREKKLGLVFLGITVGLALLWGIQYPLLVQLATGIPSRIMGFVWIQTGVFAAAVAYPAVRLFRSDDFIY